MEGIYFISHLLGKNNISLLQLVEGPGQHGTGAARIQAHETFPLLAEDLSLIHI